MMAWTKLPPFKGRPHQGCLHAPPVQQKLSMQTRLGVGFGFAGVERDDEIVWSEPYAYDFERELPTMQTFENMARKDPDHDWRAIEDGPLRNQTWQRHGRNLWVLVISGQGFA